MPKQRNHPHHHGHTNRTRRSGGLQLPELRLFSPGQWGPRYLYPPGWLSRPSGEGAARMYLLAAVIAVAFLLLIFACVGGVTLLQALLGAH